MHWLTVDGEISYTHKVLHESDGASRWMHT